MIPQLRADGLKQVDPCPLCGLAVGFHDQVASAAATGTVLSFPSTAAVKGNTINPLRTIKFATWSKDQSCKVFLDALERQLKVMNVPEDQWITSLVLVFGDDDLALDWVHANIIEADCSWSEARALFVGHFQAFDYDYQLQRDWYAIKQLAGESVQSYIHRFNRLVQQRGLRSDGMIRRISLILCYISTPFMQKEYLRWQTQRKCNALMLDGDGHRVSELTLKQVQDVCGTLSVGHSSLAISEHSAQQVTNAKKSGNTNATGAKKSCVFHPDSKTHNTADCRAMKPSTGQSLVRPLQSSPSKRQQAFVEAKTEGACFRCHQKGHMVRDCPMPRLEATTNTTPPIQVVTSNVQRLVNLLLLLNQLRNPMRSSRRLHHHHLQPLGMLHGSIASLQYRISIVQWRYMVTNIMKQLMIWI